MNDTTANPIARNPVAPIAAILAAALFLLHRVPATTNAAAGGSGAELDELGRNKASAGAALLGYISELDGEVRLRYFNHFNRLEADRERQRLELDLQLDVGGDIGEKLSYALAPRLRLDSVGLASGVVEELVERHQDRFILNLDEAYLTYTAETFDVALGKKIYAWGTADGYNPTDNINPIDLKDLPTAEKIGVPSLAVSYSSAALNVECIVAPWFTPTRLPDDGNRWQGDFSDAEAAFSPFLPVRGDRELPPNTVETAQYGVRVSSSSLVDGWDFSLSYYDGVDHIGVFRADPALPQVVLTQVFTRFREIGADFSTVFGQLEVHGEAAAHYTDGDAMDDDYVEYVLGVNYSVTAIPFELLEEINITLEFADEIIFDEKPEPNEFTGTGEYIRPFSDSILSNIDFKISEETKINLLGAVIIGDDDYFLRSSISHKINDDTKIETSFEIIDGPEDGFLNPWTKNDRFYLMLTRYF